MEWRSSETCFGILLCFRYLQLEARKRIGIVAKSQVNYAFVSRMVRLCLSGDPDQVRIHQGFHFQLPRINFLTSKLATEACLQPRSQGISDILTWITPTIFIALQPTLHTKEVCESAFHAIQAPTVDIQCLSILTALHSCDFELPAYRIRRTTAQLNCSVHRAVIPETAFAGEM